MKTTEIILLACGGILFLFSIVFMFLLYKKDKPIMKMIWFMVLSFIMMGFPVISEANIIGIVNYKKEKEREISDVAFLTEALAKCPENDKIKDKLVETLKIYDKHEETPSETEEIKKIGKAHLVLGNEEKAISYSDKVLASDTANQAAKDLKITAQTQQLIKQLPANEADKQKVARKVVKNIRDLEKSPTVNKEQVKQLKNMYRKRMIQLRDSL